MTRPVLTIANKNYSSWSLRAWLLLKEAKIDFEERLIPLAKENSLFQIRSRSPSGRLPLFEDGTLLIWDSLSIADYVAENLAPQLSLWPKEKNTKAWARSLCCEMHSGFAALRMELPMNIKLRKEIGEVSDECRDDISRLFQIFTQTRKAHGHLGNFLFGNFSIVDAYFAPVISRFQTYGIEYPNQDLIDYRDQILELKSFQEWTADALKETHAIPKYDSI